MIRTRFALAFLACGLLACASQGGDTPPEMEEDRQSAYVGGWDGAATQGSSVLLLREGLTGTLSSALLNGHDAQYQVTFEVEGDVAEDGDDLILSLGCAEIRMRPMLTAGPNGPRDPSPDEEEVAEWSSMDCAGWELDLECGLAGQCGMGDCNMICDVIYFGDAYATAAVELAAVEDEFDHWRRV